MTLMNFNFVAYSTREPGRRSGADSLLECATVKEIA